MRGEEGGPATALACTAVATLLLAAGVWLLDGDAGLVCGAVAVVVALGASVVRAQAAIRHDLRLSAGLLVVERWWGRWCLRRWRVPLSDVRAARLAGDRIVALRVLELDLDDGSRVSMLADAHSLRDSRELVSWLSSRAAEARARRVVAPEPPVALLGLVERARLPVVEADQSPR